MLSMVYRLMKNKWAKIKTNLSRYKIYTCIQAKQVGTNSSANSKDVPCKCLYDRHNYWKTLVKYDLSKTAIGITKTRPIWMLLIFTLIVLRCCYLVLPFHYLRRLRIRSELVQLHNKNFLCQQLVGNREETWRQMSESSPRVLKTSRFNVRLQVSSAFSC
jgi:hypothetical protein